MAYYSTAPVYSGNNVYIRINNQLVGFVENLSITRSVNRRPVFQVGSPLFVDAPATQATVTVTASNMVPLQGRADSGQSMSQMGIVPSGSLADVITSSVGYDIEVLDQIDGNSVYYIRDALYNQDAVQVPGTDIMSYNLSWIARDSQTWT